MRKSALVSSRVCRARLAVMAAVAVSFAGRSSGQEQARVHGLVRDAGGSPVEGARVDAMDGQGSVDQTVVSASDGSYRFDHLTPGHHLFKAMKLGFAASSVVAQELAANGDSQVNLTLHVNEGFLKRLAQAYAEDWKGTASSGPSPPSRSLPSPLNSPPFPNADWSYGGSPEIGAPDTNVLPLMAALYAGPSGKAWEDSRVKIYGWLEGSMNLSTSHDSNYPSAYDIFANRVELDQAVVYIERLPDTVQTDHFDWGFHITGLFGTSYRFTTNLGYFSSQLLDDHRVYGFDPALEYVDLYFPQVAEGMNIRIGRFISIPGIEAQLAPNNYVYTHSLLYSVDPFTDTGLLASIKVSAGLLVQMGVTASHDVAAWSGYARPSATVCLSYTFHDGNDNVYPCINGINNGMYSYNNLQMFDNTWYHKFNASWHMATEAWYMYQRDVPSIFGPVTPIKGTNGAYCATGEIRCLAPEWAAVNYLEKQVSPKDYISIRTDFLDDMKGQRTGYKNRYAEETLMWGHWIGSTVLFRPEIRYDRAFDRPAYDYGLRRNQFTFAMDVIFKY